MKLEARRQNICSLNSAFEVFWRELIRILIDESKFKDIHLTKVRSHKFSFKELDKILDKKMSLGELLTNVYSFQSRFGLESIIRDLFGLNLYKELRQKRMKFQLVEVGKTDGQIIDMSEILDKCIPAIDKVNLIRNATCHDVGTNFRPSKKTIIELDHRVWMFNFYISTVVDSIFKRNTKVD